jgi:long-chain fatty acid transport protein
MLPTTKIGIWVSAWIIACSLYGVAHGQAISVTGVGPVNRAMGGAGTAAPLDAIGALHWNPASISGLSQSELSFGVELINVDIDLTTTIAGLGTNTTNGDGGFSAIPTVGWVHKVEDTPLTFGLGVMAVAGFKNNMPMDAANLPLASGPAYADAEFLQLVPTVSYSISDRLSFGVAPTVMLGSVTLNPIGPSVFTPTPTPGSGNRVHWGGGFQIGAYYIANDAWRFGFTYKSKQWFETFHFNTPGGTFLADLDYPMIMSLGTAFTGLDDWTIAADVRYFGYGDVDAFKNLGFSNVFAFAIGAQKRVSDRLHLRAGYNFNANPLHKDDAFNNIITPLIQEQNVAMGGSWRLACNVDLNAAYVYLVESNLTGPFPTGPADTLSHEIEGHSALLGVTVRY